MIDLHSHVLPDVDDGAPDWDGTLRMLAHAANAGTQKIVATPHSHEYWRGPLPAPPQIDALVREANERARQAGLAIEVLPGQEILIEPDLARQMAEGEWRPMGDSDLLLIELPFSEWPNFTEDVLFDLQLAGYTILLAHPERYRAVHKEPARLFNLVERGVYCQVTTASLTGRFGAGPERWARRLLEHGQAHVLASDSHNTRGRHPALDEGVEIAASLVGAAAAARLVQETPAALLAGEPVESLPLRPIPREGRRWFGRS